MTPIRYFAALFGFSMPRVTLSERCGTCRHWKPEHLTKAPGFEKAGWCGYRGSLAGNMHPDQGGVEPGRFVCHADFGCVHWSAP